MAHSLGIRSSNMLSRTVPRSIQHLYPSTTTTTIFSNRQRRQQQQQPQCRAFSQTQISKVKGGSMSSQMVMPKMPPERSSRTKMREVAPENIPTDFGLLPGTFIRPEGKDMPSIFKDPKLRLQFEWAWIRNWVESAIATVMLLKRTMNPPQPLQLSERKNIGKELHHLMYFEFARGNERIIREKCCPGLAKDLINSIRKRSPHEGVSWALEKYIRTPSTFFTGVRVLSDRATIIPQAHDSAIRQVVLRISSQQVTAKVARSHEEFPFRKDGRTTPPKVAQVTEYVVIQKVRIFGHDRDWQIWGFTSPTTVEDLDSPFFSSGVSLKERLQGIQDKLAGTGKR